MGKKSKRENRIPKTESPPPITFSFRFYDDSSLKFCISEWKKEKIALSIQKLKQINDKTCPELIKGNETFHFHPVNWEKTVKKTGFPDARANRLDPFQFALPGVNSGKARVYGALGNNIFHIIWFDLNHEIWPSFKKYT
mgnify:CR=1 FL=1